MHRFPDMATYTSVENRLKTYPTLIWHIPWGVTPCGFFSDKSYLVRKWNHGAIRRCTFHDPAFALLDTIPAVTDRRTLVGQTRCCRKDRAMHSVARVKQFNISCIDGLHIDTKLNFTANDLRHSGQRRRRLWGSCLIYEFTRRRVIAQLQLQQLWWYSTSSVPDCCSVRLCFATTPPPSRRSPPCHRSLPDSQRPGTGSRWPGCWCDRRRRRAERRWVVWTAMLSMTSHAVWTESTFASWWFLSPVRLGGSSAAVGRRLRSVWTTANHKQSTWIYRLSNISADAQTPSCQRQSVLGIFYYP